MKTVFFWSVLFLIACQSETTPANDKTTPIQAEGQLDIDALENPSYTSDEQMQLLFDNNVNNEQVFIKAKVIKVLPDDNDGSRHQKFIVKLNSGQTILVAHNIDLANRISGLKENDNVKIFGEYEWSEKGGVIHWTHHDPNHKHIDGWIEHQDLFYEKNS